jgi:hypothetical protein
MGRKNKSKTILTAVVISVAIAFFLDFITPDVWTLLYFKGEASPQQLFQWGLIGLTVGLLTAIALRYRGQRTRRS